MKRAYAMKIGRNLRQALDDQHQSRARPRVHSGVGDSISIETSSVCNLDCRFCAYVKKQSAKVTMAKELFRDCVEQAVAMGFCRAHLTPCTGDVFMDRGLFDKLALLDEHPGIVDYGFFTNFTIPDRQTISSACSSSRTCRSSISACTAMTRPPSRRSRSRPTRSISALSTISSSC